MSELDFDKCSKDPETCPIVGDIFAIDSFVAEFEDGELTPDETRNLLGDLVTACALGRCPGRNPEFARQVLRARGDDEDFEL